MSATAQVLVHPTVLAWVRRCSGASFLALTPKDAQPYLELGLVMPVSGTLHDTRKDADAGKLSNRGLYVLTRHALRLAYPDGVLVRKYQCSVCEKVTAGRMSRGGPDETDEIPWYPRKHTTTGRRRGPTCPGSDRKAVYVKQRITF